jgi:hypothetical protein
MMFMNKADKIIGMLTEVRKIGYDATIVAVKDRLSPLTIELIQKLEQSLASDHRDLCCGVRSCEGEFTMNVGVVTKVNFSVGIPQ